MSKRNKTKQPSPQPEPMVETPAAETVIDTQEQAQPEPEGETAKPEPKKDPLAGLRTLNVPQFVTVDGPKDKTLGERAEELSAIRQKLAEAKDMADKGEADAKALSETLGDCGRRLYAMRADGSLSAELLTETLGNVFGFQKRGKGGSQIRVPAGNKDASATPFGEGDVIRKRIVRMVAAHDYVVNGNRSAFFDNLPVDEVQPVVETLANGGSIWSAYQALTDLKAAKRTRLEAAFNAKTISSINEKLSEAAAIDLLADGKNNELRVAYNNLLTTLWALMTDVNQRLSQPEGTDTE